ncbi:MAG: uroporphyrinogen-III C-methyltransferase [Verrucomicrobia bacterium]|nr:MAG: uroporphyrinogen-III C-methyltransferase [Verrucomicrobiota bacterium]
MTSSCMTIRLGTRNSRLALLQHRDALTRIEKLLPVVRFELVTLQTPGDRDRTTDLRVSPPDFFTRDLDAAVRAGRLDGALHSAKDLPAPMTAGLDWCWLPWREDPRDALVLSAGKTWADLPAAPVVGVSSERRETYARWRCPAAVLRTVRGNIEERIAQLDAGNFDVLMMAGAALTRLGLQARITEWVPLDDLPTPDGQGYLALTFRAGDPALTRLRSLFVKTVTFVGAGAGQEACTLAGLRALRQAEVCLHDTLLDPNLLNELPRGACVVNVGKRCRRHHAEQGEINDLVASYVRQGKRVVRLKGGDPGLFGRLAEELAALDALHLPYRVIPGVSSLQAATTGTGLLLTRRGVSRGFCALTPRAKDGAAAPVTRAVRSTLPVVFFMGADVVGRIMQTLIENGTASETPAAMVFAAGGEQEKILRATLGAFAGQTAESPALVAAMQQMAEQPGLLIVGAVARYGYDRTHGALQGRRVLLTCSEVLLEKAADVVRGFGGRPVARPLIRLVPKAEAQRELARLDRYGWLLITSPSAVRCLQTLLRTARLDIRHLPKLAVCGPGTAAELEKTLGLFPAFQASSDFGGAGVLADIEPLRQSGKRVLRVRSDKAGAGLADALRRGGLDVTDLVIYKNERIRYAERPEFDAVFFASASAVEAYVDLWGAASLAGRTIVAIGEPTVTSLQHAGLAADVVGFEATVTGAITALAAQQVNAALSLQLREKRS